MNNYKNIRIILTLIILFYLTSAVALKFYKPTNEIFPLFTWELYAKVPNRINDYTIRIISINDEKLTPPIYYQDSKKYFSKAHSVSAYFAFKKLGEAVRSGKKINIDFERRYIEQIYLSGYKSLEYEIIVRKYNPIAKIKYNKFKAHKLGAVYKSGVYE